MNFKNKIRSYFCAVLCMYLAASSLLATNSIVYNLRIAETTKDVPRKPEYPGIAIITPFVQLREKYDKTKLIFGGGLGTLLYVTKTYYARVDGALARVVQKSKDQCRSRMQTDDLLFSGGYKFRLTNRINMTLSGLFGLPTHDDTHFDMGQFGYAHIGLGPQIDVSFILDALSRHSIRTAFRFIRFFPRYAFTYQSLPERVVDFTMGNMIDFFLAYHFVFGKNQFDIGYDANIYNHVRTNNQIAPTFVRNIGFVSYKRVFSVCDHPASLDLAFSYANDTPRSTTNYIRLITGWVSLGFDF
ncbi:MAG: hypothetical protein M1114_05430 [Candidatus Dependentiae bacterium]|nr:hypothetical protein [Candidatus Dependentiae bacterium]